MNSRRPRQADHVAGNGAVRLDIARHQHQAGRGVPEGETGHPGTDCFQLSPTSRARL